MARFNGVQFFHTVGAHLQQTVDSFGGHASGVVGRRHGGVEQTIFRFQRTAVHPHKHHVPPLRVVLYFERQRRQGFVGPTLPSYRGTPPAPAPAPALAFHLLLFFSLLVAVGHRGRTMAGPVLATKRGRWEQQGNRVHQRLDRTVSLCCPTQQDQGVGQFRLVGDRVQRGPHFIPGDVLGGFFVQIQFGKGIVVVTHLFDQRFAGSQGSFVHLRVGRPPLVQGVHGVGVARGVLFTPQMPCHRR